MQENREGKGQNMQFSVCLSLFHGKIKALLEALPVEMDFHLSITDLIRSHDHF